MKLAPEHWAAIGAGVLLAGGAAYFILRKDTVSSSAEDPTVPDSPAALAADAGVGLATYCLARAIASEAGGSPRTAQIAVGWTIQNYADAHAGGDLVVTILGSASAFGPQGSGGRRYVSTSRAPLQSQLTLAAQIIAEQVADPTGGATNFDSPKEQAREHAQNPRVKTPEQVADERMSSGLVAYDVDVAGADFRFWGPA